MIGTRPRARVACQWPDSTVVCLGTGPSLTQADVDACRDRARVIAVNDAYRYAPWADVLYACDRKWWDWHNGVPAFTGQKFGLETGARYPAAPWPGVQLLQNTGHAGLELDPSGLRTGQNSGYQAINLAVHLGASTVVLLGYDMQGDHCFGAHPDQSTPHFPVCLAACTTLVEPLRLIGVSVINCTRQTALTCFPRQSLAEALAEVVCA